MRRGQSIYNQINVICTVLFGAFTFLYLYFYQADLLAYSQHVLSGGLTQYNTFYGAVIITVVLLIVTFVASGITYHSLFFLPALFTFPSALLLGLLTGVNVLGESSKHLFGNTWIISIILFVLYLFFINALKRFILPASAAGPLSFVRSLALNMCILLCICTYIILVGNSNGKQHIDLRAESMLMDNMYDDVAAIGTKQQYCDEHLLTLRAYAMEKNNTIGDKFFNNCIPTSSKCLLPSKENPLLIFPEARIYKMLGAAKPNDMSVREYLHLMDKRNLLKKGRRDYLYMAALLDCDLDAFVDYYIEGKDSTAVVPKHYREALVLYKHLRVNPKISYSTPEMETDYEDFEALIKKNPVKAQRDNALRDSYGNTYWYYYYKKGMRL